VHLSARVTALEPFSVQSGRQLALRTSVGSSSARKSIKTGWQKEDSSHALGSVSGTWGRAIGKVEITR
jgi:hypothetical protein